MRTLVYFASRYYKSIYQKLQYDQVILVDYCFMNRENGMKQNQVLSRGKVTMLGMDCLEAIDYLKQKKIMIDCFVSINEGLSEGGGDYVINSGFFIGYTMPILNDNYIHIMSQKYYGWHNNNWSDLPYKIQELSSDDTQYIEPEMFSTQGKDAKVYRMSKFTNSQIINIKSNKRLKILHDSIWNYYDTLECLVISIKDQGQGEFFNKIPKVINIQNTCIEEVFQKCINNRYESIGFTPWANGFYQDFLNMLSNYKGDYPKEVFFFHLNLNDYKEIKKYNFA